MFIKKSELQELKERIRLLEHEVRWLLYEKIKSENPDKLIRTPSGSTNTVLGELSIDQLKMKYRGCKPCDY